MTMNPDSIDPGRSTVEPINLLEAAAFDFLDGNSPPPQLGKTEVPVNVLPMWTLGTNEEASLSPALILTFRLRPAVNASTATFDLFGAFAVLDRYEISLGGMGLTPDESESDLMPTNGMLKLVLTATQSAGAASRLARLAAAVNESDTTLQRDKLAGRSFTECKAEVRTAA
jgi:hypothetical protein